MWKFFLFPLLSYVKNSNMPAPLLQLTDVTKRYAVPHGGSGANGVNVLASVTLEVARGETLAIVGPSGSGKSTLLQIIGTLDRPTSGQVLLEGHDLSTLDDLKLAAVRNGQIGFVFQSHYLLPQCTVLENVLVPTLANAGQASRLSPSEEKKGKLETGGTPVLRETAYARAGRLLKRVAALARAMSKQGGRRAWPIPRVGK